MIRILITLAIALVLAPCANSQGLKGAGMPEKILGRLEYIKGNNDQWSSTSFPRAQTAWNQVETSLLNVWNY